MANERQYDVNLYKDENLRFRLHNYKWVASVKTDDLIEDLTNVILQVYDNNIVPSTAVVISTMLINPTHIVHAGAYVTVDVPCDSLAYGIEYWYDIQYVKAGSSEPIYVKGGKLTKTYKLDRNVE